jgi:predicted Zn-dependent peptidase
MQREIGDYASGAKPASVEEVQKAVADDIRSQPGAYETASAVMGTIGGIVRYDRPDDWVVRRNAEVVAMTPDQVNAAAKTLDANALTWVVVGDLSKIEAPVRALNLGTLQVIDADGKPVAAATPTGTAAK